MRGVGAILEAVQRARRDGETVVLATVVQVHGSSYRRPGARMLFRGEGAPVGFVSGGCLEGDLAQQAEEVLRSGSARTVVYDMRSPDDIVWGLGLGCGGEIRVLLEPVLADRWPAYLGFLIDRRRERRAAVLATVFEASGGPELSLGERLVLDDDAANGTLARRHPDVLNDLQQVAQARRSVVRRYEREGSAVDVLVEHLAQEVRLVVLGAGSDARPLVRLAAGLGWEITVVDHRSAYATRERFPEALEVRCVDLDGIRAEDLDLDDGTAVVIMTHHFLHDVELLARLLPAKPSYLGVIGPQQRLTNLIEQLRGRGLSPTEEQLRRLYGPVGLDIGSETPEEIALSILAEIQAVLAGRPAGFLRDRERPLHDWPS